MTDFLLYRKWEHQLLIRFLSMPALFRHIHLYGGRGCGKKLLVSTALSDVGVLSKALSDVGVLSCLVNCFQFEPKPKPVFESILNAVQHAVNPSQALESYKKCENPCDFLTEFKSKLIDNGVERLVLVLNQAERLRHAPPQVMLVLTKLQELMSVPVTVVTLSYLPWSKFLVHSGVIPRPHHIHIAYYSLEELTAILQAESNGKLLYGNFCKALVDLVGIFCNDLVELKLLAQIWYPIYISPLSQANVKKEDYSKLFNIFAKHIKRAIKKGFLMDGPNQRTSNLENELDIAAEDLCKKVDCPELGRLPKLLLIASYLASYNPPITDKRFFLKYSKYRRPWSLACATESKSSHIIGPKAFHFERVLLIFACIVDTQTKHRLASMNLTLMMSNLVRAGFVTKMSAVANLDSPKYRCNTQWDTIEIIAKSVDFEIHGYLYDFRS